MTRLISTTRMHRHLTLLATAIGLTLGTAIAAPASSQSSLEERLEEIRKEVEAHQQKQSGKGELTPVQMLQRLFYGEVTVDFVETPVKDAIAFIGEALDVRVVGRYADDTTANGIDSNLTVTLQAEDMTALAALDFILAVASTSQECTWQLRNGYVEVGPKDRLAMGGSQIAKSYPITDLLMEIPDFDNAPPQLLEDQLGYRHGGWYGPYDGRGYGYGPRIVRGGQFGGYGGGQGGSITPGGLNNQQPAGKRALMKQKAEDLMTFIKSIVEPGHWRDEGGDWASIAYYDGVLVVRAPDFIHRQIGGYPKIPGPEADDDEPEPTKGGAKSAR